MGFGQLGRLTLGKLGSGGGGGGLPAVPPLYQDDFSSDTTGEWVRGTNSVDGTITIVDGVLVYTRGSGDGAYPRIIRTVTGFEIGVGYVNTFSIGGNAPDRRLYLSHSINGTGPGATADTVLSPQSFTSDRATYYVTLIGVGLSIGQTVTLDNILVEKT